jgi:nucleoside-diphosphate-sugar epimerase
MIGPLLSMTSGKAVAWLPPSIVPTADSILLLLKSLFIDTLMTVPALLQELADLDQGRGLDALGQLKMVASGGGPIGDCLMEALRSANVPLLNAFGITEIGGLNVMFVPKSDYDCRYFRFRADMGLELRQLNEGEAAHELSATPPGWTERFVARDVLERRPGSSELDFRSVARNDGLVILSTGLKFVPNALEQRVVSSDDSIGAALIFGNERPEIGWLIEPKTTVLTHEAPSFRARVWSVIEEAQSNEPDYSMVWTPDLVIVITGERRLPRSDKGSVMRTAAYTAFEKDVSRAYESLAFDSAAQPTDLLDKGNITNGIRDCVSHFISLPETATNDSDLFELGLNSILALQLSRYIAARRPDQSIQLRAAFVYESPTVNQIAAILAGSTRPPCHGIMPENHASQMVAKYSILSGEADKTSHTVVLLTGATGSLGSHILADLITDNSVARVICLVRESALSFQERLRTKGTALQPRDMAKVIVVECHFTRTKFGLTSAQYEEIARQVTHVLHCAWPMDFRLTANSFEAQYAVLQDLLRLMEESSSVQNCATSRFLFVSSIAVVNQCARFYDGQPAPEKLIDWSDITFELGYGQAKAICEMILANVARTSRPYSIRVVRLGQVSGSSQTGYWNTAEHLPTLFKMSKLANAFPRLTGVCVYEVQAVDNVC